VARGGVEPPTFRFSACPFRCSRWWSVLRWWSVVRGSGSSLW